MTKVTDPKKRAAIALRKAQSHIERVLHMIDEDEYCITILEQILAVNGLTQAASRDILRNHLNTCFIHDMKTATTDQQRETLIDEVLTVVSLSKKHK